MQIQLGHTLTPWPAKNWNFDQLTLAALYYNPKLSLARAQWALARAKAVRAGAYPNPTLRFLPQYASHVPANVSPWKIGLSINIPLLTTDRRSYRIARALANAEAMRLNIIQTAWQIRASLRQTLIKRYAAHQRLKLLRRRMRDSKALLRAINQRVSAGQDAQSQAIPAQLAWIAAQLAQENAVAARNHARTAFAGAIGIPVSALSTVKITFSGKQKLLSLKSLSLAKLTTDALTQRPDIRAALKHYTARQLALQLAIVKQYPMLNIGPGYQWDQGMHKWSLGFSLTLPLFNQSRGVIAQARARRAQAAAAFRVLQAQITTQLETALAAYSAAKHKLTLTRHLLMASKARLIAVRAAYRAGEINYITLLRTQLDTYNDRLTALKTHVQTMQALGALENALEHPLYRPTITTQALNHADSPPGR